MRPWALICVVIGVLGPTSITAEEPTPNVLRVVEGFSGHVPRPESRPPLPEDAGEYRVVIVTSANAMLLFAGDSLVRRYTVAVGNDSIGKATPPGRYRIINKIKDPPMLWHDGTYIPPGDWRNSYGSRWMSLGDAKSGRYHGYGMHGTNAPHSVGLVISAGCIRMYDADVIELFDAVEIGTPVEIR
jgi:lipoprotein-anchoring transpeptidase ErfK/SrfK